MRAVGLAGILVAIALGADESAQSVRDVARDLLRGSGFTEDDLRIRDRELLHPRSPGIFRDDDPHLPAAVRPALERPLAIPARAERWARRAHGAHGLLDTARALADLHPFRHPLPARGSDPLALPEGVDARLAEALRGLYRAASAADARVREALRAISDDERAHLRRWLPRWVARSTKEGAERARAGEEDEEERAALLRTAEIWERVDRALLRAAWSSLLAAADHAVPRLRGARWAGPEVRIDTPQGPVVLRGSGRGTTNADALLLVDTGGDDEYRLAESVAWRPVRVVVDADGDDLYLGAAPHAWGAGFLGLSLHVDLAGDDDYRARDWGIGCGLGGHGMVWDRAGDDRYHAGLGSVGAGIFGSGVVRDDAGDDEYVADLFCQGFASTGGMGAVLDRAGRDLYLAGRDEEDIWRRPGTYITFAQGSAYGHRFGHVYRDAQGRRRWKTTGQLPGGVGVLFDAGGDDRYSADVFGQGSAYWYSLGLVVDGGGSDRYRTTWYGQGVGTHCAAGCVVDAGGDDRYLSRNTSQGCGHDFSAGILVDRGGNDRYRSMALSQGAGNAACGLGVLVDGAGDDRYECAGGSWGLGRELKSAPGAAPFGLFADLGGRNEYAGQGAARPGERWRQPPRGFGRDGP